LKDYQYHLTLNELVTHTRLHVAMLNAASKKHVPIATSNAQYIKYLKPKQKQAKWKPVKNEIKWLINIGRKNGDLGQKLEELNRITSDYLYNTVDRLFDLLNEIEAEHTWDSTMLHSPKACKQNTFYFDLAEIERIKDEDAFLRELTVYVCEESLPLAKEIMETKVQYEFVERDVVADTEPRLLKCALVVLGF